MPDLELLSPEWVDAFASAGASLPSRRGATARLGAVVVGGPGGRKAERAWRFAFEDGRVASAESGVAPDGSVDLVVTQPWDDAVAMLRGDDTLDEAFMRGTTKLVGSAGVLMDLLPVLRSEEWRALCGSMAARTAL